MMNMIQMQRHIEALNHTVDPQRERIQELELALSSKQETTHSVWAVIWLTTILGMLAFIDPCTTTPTVAQPDCSAEKQRTVNTMGVLKQVTDERDRYAEATAWLLEHSVPK
jgi:hypothetical protein